MRGENTVTVAPMIETCPDAVIVPPIMITPSRFYRISLNFLHVYVEKVCICLNACRCEMIALSPASAHALLITYQLSMLLQTMKSQDLGCGRTRGQLGSMADTACRLKKRHLCEGGGGPFGQFHDSGASLETFGATARLSPVFSTGRASSPDLSVRNP